MKYQFIEKNRSAFAVEKMCRVLKVTTSGYYRQKKGGISKRALSNEQLDRAIRAAHKQSRGNYGSPRITKELKEQGDQLQRKPGSTAYAEKRDRGQDEAPV